MKNLPFWMAVNGYKAIFIAAIANSILRTADSGKFLRGYPADSLTADDRPSTTTNNLRLPLDRLLNPGKLHPVSIAFLTAELLDMLTTIIGLFTISGIWEANPLAGGMGGWMRIILLKIAVVSIVVAGIEMMRRPVWIGSFRILSGELPRLIWVIPAIAGLPVVWNILVILLEVAA